ncbi:mitochondrial fission 1 protein [Aplysia californica]|uniref:Mitochondrial fission 1 protein n=1 Tax=Aplysia californica TaxID=6500 RepID=A0ABM1ABA8_APLCA|nr:mitochondrial fission 1 protein [Aplysia californica]XP_012944418.1 mitochondrial fission 1 protein [Aplysia californica]
METIVEENIDPNDLKKFEGLYNEQARRGHISEKTQFDYAWCLIRSRYVSDMHKGIALLEDLMRIAKDDLSQRDYLFYIAVGFVRIKEYERALKYTEAIRKIEPNNRQAQQLDGYIKAKMKKDGLLGMAIVGGAVLALGGLVGATIAAVKKK